MNFKKRKIKIKVKLITMRWFRIILIIHNNYQKYNKILATSFLICKIIKIKLKLKGLLHDKKNRTLIMIKI